MRNLLNNLGLFFARVLLCVFFIYLCVTLDCGFEKLETVLTK